MRILFALLILHLGPLNDAHATSACSRHAYLSYFQSLPTDRNECPDKRESLRSELIEAAKAFAVCSKSASLASAPPNKSQVDKYCSEQIWEFLGDLDQNLMDPNGRDFCLKHVDIKAAILADCRNSI